MGVHQAIKQEKVYTTKTLKIDPYECFHLKYPYNSYIFKIYQKHYFYTLYKTKKLKIIVLAFYKQENLATITDKMISVRKC